VPDEVHASTFPRALEPRTAILLDPVG